jgi:hypothetical protein
MIKMASSDHKVRSSVPCKGDLAVRVAADIAEHERQKKEKDVKAYREQIHHLASTPIAQVAAELKDSALVAAYASSHETSSKAVRGNPVMDLTEEELACCFDNEPTPESENVINAVVAESFLSGTELDKSLENQPIRANTETVASYKIGSKLTLDIKADLREGILSIIMNKDDLQKFCSRGGLSNTGHFVNLHHLASILVEEAILPDSVIRKALFVDVAKGKYRLISDWAERVPQDLKRVILSTGNDKWTTIFRDPNETTSPKICKIGSQNNETVFDVLPSESEGNSPLPPSSAMSEIDKRFQIAKWEYETEKLRYINGKRKRGNDDKTAAEEDLDGDDINT